MLLCKFFCENKKLNLELESSFYEIASLGSMQDDMGAKPCDNCTMIKVNYVDLWLVHCRVASQLDGARLEHKARSLLLGTWTSCPLFRSDLEASTVEIKDFKHKLEHPFRYSALSPPCELKGKLFNAMKENTNLKQEVAYLSTRLEKTVLSEKMIEEDLSRVDESATKSTYKLCVGFERCEDKGGKSAPKFIPSSSYHQEEKVIKSAQTHYPFNPKPSFDPKRGVRKETRKPREEAFVCMFCGRAGHLDEFCF
jgi:regulator of replication initiation timing